MSDEYEPTTSLGDMLAGVRGYMSTANDAMSKVGKFMTTNKEGKEDYTLPALLAGLGRGLYSTPLTNTIANITGSAAMAAAAKNERANQLASLSGQNKKSVEDAAAEDYAKKVRSNAVTAIDLVHAAPPPPPKDYFSENPEVAPTSTEVNPNLIQTNTSLAPPFRPAPLPNPSLDPGSINAASPGSTPAAAPVIEAVPDGNVAVANIIKQIVGSGGGMPDPMAIAAASGALGPEQANKAYDILHNARVADATTIKSVADMIEAQSNIPYKRAQAAKHDIDVVEAKWKMSDEFIKFQERLEFAKKSGEKGAEKAALDILIANASTVKIKDPVLSKYFDDYGQLIKATGATNPGAIAAGIRAFGDMMSASTTAAGQERASSASILLGVSSELDHLNALKDPDLYTKEQVEQMTRMEAVNKTKTLLTPADKNRKEVLTAVKNIALKSLLKSKKAEGEVDLSTRRRPTAVEIPKTAKGPDGTEYTNSGRKDAKGRTIFTAPGKKDMVWQ